MPEISAREAFELFQVIAAAMTDNKEVKQDYLTNLVDQAFSHDPSTYEKAIGSILT